MDMENSTCPKCGGDGVNIGHEEEDGSIVSTAYICGACSYEWQDIYEDGEVVDTTPF